MKASSGDWREERARARRAVRRVHRHQNAGMMRTILAGGHPCEACGAYAVRYSVAVDGRVCGECGHIQTRPAA